MRHLFLLSAAAVALPLFAGSAAAQSCEGECPNIPVYNYEAVDPAGPTFVPPAILPPPPPPPAARVAAVSPEAAPGVSAAQVIEDATAFCRAVGNSYQVDCLAERISAAARQLPRDGNYAASKAILDDAARKLSAVAAKYRDPALPRQTYAAPSMARPVSTSRPLTPVSEANREAATLEALAILDETTVLLRSSATETVVAPQVERIAAAVNSNKVLLRSA